MITPKQSAETRPVMPRIVLQIFRWMESLLLSACGAEATLGVGFRYVDCGGEVSPGRPATGDISMSL